MKSSIQDIQLYHRSLLSPKTTQDPSQTSFFIIGTAVTLIIWSFEGAEGFAICFWHLIVLPIGCIYTYSYKKMKQEWEKEHGIYNASEERKKAIEDTITNLLLACVFTVLFVFALPLFFGMTLL